MPSIAGTELQKHLSQRSAVINHKKTPKQAFIFLLCEPTAPLSALVQAIWTASVLQSEPLIKPLYADAGSGIIFNFLGQVTIGNETLPEGVILLPIKNQAENIVLTPGAKLAGIRFHPAMGYGVLGKHYEKPTLLTPEDDHLYNLYQIYSRLRIKKINQSLLDELCLWADNHLDFIHAIPNSLEKALNVIEKSDSMETLSESTHISQRQIERHFKFWLGMTPKHYQRILRIKKAISFLRRHENANLADVAHQFGFSDQAHMTREFRAIAHITPGKVS